jgi:hypothetical protein
MQSVVDAFSVEATDSMRRIAQNTSVAWKKDYRSTIRFFTVGSSSIGGSDIIAGPSSVQSQWMQYLYNDESSYVTRIDYERELKMPEGGLVKALADVDLDNTSGRFTPGYMGGLSELHTAILPRRPLKINAGFNVSGIDQTIPQFIGVTSRMVEIDKARGSASLHAEDFIGFLQNQYVDKSEMFTSERTHVVMERVLQNLGFSTAQYDLDEGINVIKFGLFETGQRWGDLFDKMARAENAHVYQSEEGKIKFENRQHWDASPYTDVQRVITTAQVINAETPGESHLINVVEVIASPREVGDTERLIGTDTDGSGLLPQTLDPGDTEVWVNYDDPVYEVITPVPYTTPNRVSYYIANTQSNISGTDLTSSVSLKSITNFAQASKLVFTNSSGTSGYMNFVIWGRAARKTGDIYYKEKTDASITAYEEHVLKIENDYIQDETWAQSFARMILQDFSQPENLQVLTVRAIPELQFGDLISWQGHYWRVFGIKTKIDPGAGFVQELKLLQRTIHPYFRIGVSSIGGRDEIAP